jgi:hypothetical protein
MPLYPDKKISAVWWFIIPALFLTACVGAQLFMNEALLDGILDESGPVEILQTLIVGTAFIAAAALIPRAVKTKNRFLLAWTILAAIGTFYITGEEISWGQHIFEWKTPGQWMQVNDHYETNLHNTSSWFDQKPRTLLEAGMLIGAIVLPEMEKRKPLRIVDKYKILLPPTYLAMTAIVLWIFKLMKDVSGWFNVGGVVRISEMNEVCIYYFILLYTLAFGRRLNDLNKIQES